MKVKELRNWLADFAERNKQHQMRSQVPLCHNTGTKQEGTSKGNQYLVIKCNPSITDTSSTFSCVSTSPETENHLQEKIFESRDEVASHEINLESNAWDLSLENGRSLESSSSSGMGTYYDRNDTVKEKGRSSYLDNVCDTATQDVVGTRFSEPSQVLCAQRPDEYKRRFTLDEVEKISDITPEHKHLLRTHVATFTHNFNPTMEASSQLRSKTLESSVTTKHRSIFEANILTGSTLNQMCTEDGRTKVGHPALVVSVSSSELSEDDASSLSLSGDISNPSIAPSVLDSKIARLLLDGKQNNSEQLPQNEDVIFPRRKKIDPKDLAFLNSKVKSTEEPASRMLVPKEEHSSVRLGITRFGGIKKKKKIVQQRKEQLEKFWFEQKAVTHVSKVKWGVCQRPGVYKRKVVIDIERKQG